VLDALDGRKGPIPLVAVACWARALFLEYCRVGAVGLLFVVLVPTPANATAQELGGDHYHQSRVRQRPYSTDCLCRTVAWSCFYVLCHPLLSRFLGRSLAKKRLVLSTPMGFR